MTRSPLSDPTMRIAALAGPLEQYFQRTIQVRQDDPDISDFAAGNPQELAFDAYVDALRRWSVPEDGQWFAYKMSEPNAQEVVAASLREYLGIPFEPEDIAMTNAAIAAIAVTLRTICQEGDEVIIIQPPHFLYEPLIMAAGASAVRVPVTPDTFDLDVEAIGRAITPHTRAVIVNSPHNPTGRIFPPEQLEALGAVLTEASQRHQPIYLLSDEAYNRILFDDHAFHSPVAFYPRSLLIYSYGKILLAPGERIGYIALPPNNPDREALRMGLIVNQLITGYAFPNAVLQHGMGDLDKLTIDLKHLQAKRDLMVESLRGMGYDLHVPEATFYLLPRSPIEDDVAFFELLLEERILAMPGRMLEAPGHFRLSLTASDDMIERALPGFQRALDRARA
ncbi:MAG: aminotransferase class I/II-fold pyridoxal phosphate-dependent enzyme [Actinomycetota bacterium]